MKWLIVVLAVLLFVVPASAMKLGDKINVDGYAEYIHSVEDITDDRTDPVLASRTLSIQYNTNYIFEGELGVTYDNLVRVGYGHEAIEHFTGTDTIQAELYLSKLLKLPVNAGVVAKYKWIEDRVLDDGDKFVGVGLVVRLP